MSVEIGSLVVKGTFGGAAGTSRDTSDEIDRKVGQLRSEVMAAIRAEIEEAQRRRKER